MNFPAKSVFFVFVIAALVAGACSSSGNENSQREQTILRAQVQVSAGTSHSCVTLLDGTVRCWGSNLFGLLGYDIYYTYASALSSSIPIPVSEITTAIQVSTGDDHSCATLLDGTVWCWGLNRFGRQLGNNIDFSSRVPVQVSKITTATQVSAGDNHSCATLQNGTVRCWGSNGDGQLGNGTENSSSVPVQVSGITTAIQVSTGDDHSCAILQDGTVWCWGDNNSGALSGATRRVISAFPVQVSGITTATQVSAGINYSCALLQDGTVWCWGLNHSGQLGDGTETAISRVPVQVSRIDTAIHISAGDFHSCATLQNGTVRCWGSGPLGDGTKTNSRVPVQVSEITTAIQVSAGDDHSCAALQDGTVWCWGKNEDGQLGNGTENSSSVPVQVSLGYDLPNKLSPAE